MKACKILLSIILIISEDSQHISCTSTTKTGLDLFHKNTKTIHGTMNKIFTSLRLKKNFKESMKIRLLLTMHKNLINILSNNDKNSEIENNFDKTSIKMFQQHDILNKILEEEYSQLFFSPNETVHHGLQNNTFNKSLSEHLSVYVKQFLLKVDEIVSQHYYTNDTRNENKTHNTTLKRRSRKSHKLKAWVPDAERSFGANRRIYNSKNTNIKKYPFMASVHISDEFVCGGSIIGKEFIITAASCLQKAYLQRYNKNYQSNVSVRIGSSFTTRGGQIVPISFINFHPLYNPENLKHNLALLRMSKHRRFTKKKIRRALFDTTTDDLPNDVKGITIVGWGSKDELDKEDSSKLSLAYLDLYDIEECKAVYSNLYVTESNFCAGFITEGTGACNRDVGNPAVVAGVLVGVISFGPPLCGTPDAPTVFTRLGFYGGWIENVLKMDPNKMTDAKPIIRVPADQQESVLKRKGVLGLGHIRMDNPEEYFILKEILIDIARSGSDVNDIIEKGFDMEFNEPHKVDLMNHRLVNNSVFGIFGANFPQIPHTAAPPPKKFPSTIIAYGLTIPVNDLELPENGNYNKLGQLMDVFYHHQVSNLPKDAHRARIISGINKYVNRLIGRKRSTAYGNNVVTTTPEYDADNYLSIESSGNYEESSGEGLSIEVRKPIERPIGRNIKSGMDFDDNDKQSGKTKPSLRGEDYHNIYVVLDKTIDVGKKSKDHPNIRKTTNRDQNYNDNKVIGTTKIVYDNEEYMGEDSTDSQK